MSQDQARQRARRRNLGSSLIFAALALVLLGIAGYLWYQQSTEDDVPTAPPPNPLVEGIYELVNVRDALSAQDLDATFGRSSARSTQLSNPGQAIAIGTTDTLYVFIYGSVSEREADTAELEPESLRLTAIGTPVAGSDQPPLVLVKGNIVVVLSGGDDALREKVEAAVESLPELGDGTPTATGGDS